MTPGKLFDSWKTVDAIISANLCGDTAALYKFTEYDDCNEHEDIKGISGPTKRTYVLKKFKKGVRELLWTPSPLYHI